MPDQSDRDLAEMIARFRIPPGLSWIDLANDIETLLKSRPRLPANIDWADVESLAGGHCILCDGQCCSTDND